MAGMDLVLLIGGAWFLVFEIVVALMAVASRADERFESGLTERPRTPLL